MHRNRRIPYTNAYQRVSTSAYTCHNAGLQYGQRKCVTARVIRAFWKRNSYSHAAGLSGRLVSTGAVTARVGIIRDGQAAEAGGQERKGVTGALGATVEGTVGGAGGRHAVVSTGESRLSGRVGEGGSGVRGVRRAISRVHLAHRRVGTGGVAQTARGESVVVRRATELLTKSTKATGSGGKGTGGGSAGHRVRTHAELRRGVHRRREGRVGHDGSARAGSTAAKTVDVLGKVVVTAALGAALPVTSAERNHAAISTHTTSVTTHSMAVAHVRRHHVWRSVAVTVTHRVGGRSHGRERASEAGGTALEVGETAGRAGPVTGTRAVLGGREGSENLSSPVENTAGGGRDLNGLFVEGAAVHAQAFSGLGEG